MDCKRRSMEGNTMIIQIDSREKQKELNRIIPQIESMGVKWFKSKMYCGDYQSMDNPRLCIDRKKDLQELCGNVCQQHERFRAELIRARELGIKIIILCEHGHGITCLEDVIFWQNPRRKVREYVDGKWQTFETKAMRGEHLYKILSTQMERYGVEFEFCDPGETGRRIVELLGGADEEETD